MAHYEQAFTTMMDRRDGLPLPRPGALAAAAAAGQELIVTVYPISFNICLLQFNAAPFWSITLV